MGRTGLRSPLAWILVAANVAAIAAVIWLSRPAEEIPPPVRLTPVEFAALPGWTDHEPQVALAAFERSCHALVLLAPDTPMGWEGYAGTAAAWVPACRAASASHEHARTFFETWFAPLAVDRPGHFTGYYEPEISGSLVRDGRYHIPVYGLPSDLISADLGQFRRALTGEHLEGRLEGSRIVPYPSRAEIDTHGLATAPILLYTDDPVSLFFLQIQGSGLVKLNQSGMMRLAFAGRNGRAYTPIGRVLVEQGALERKEVSMQSIRAWLKAHPQSAQAVMQADDSYVFFSLAPLGDPSLGSPGTEGVALTPGASIAVDAELHPFGAPIFVSTEIPDQNPGKPDRGFDALLIAQDTGGAIRGAARGDIFFGSGTGAEAIAGRLNAHGAFYVLVPKAVAASLKPYRELADAPQ